MNKQPEYYMARAIQIAKQGKKNTVPNPLVGAVIVYNDTIIGEGYHQQFGDNHAEINAMQQVKNKDLLKHSTLYVTLEPCCHTGKTPPCTKTILESGINNVFIGCKDPFESVNGGGIQELLHHGVQVSTGILEKECKELNKYFLTYHTKKRPYITLKWAESADGFMDILRTNEVGSYAISNALSTIWTHEWRSQSQAIAVGSNTILNDNPQLTVRHSYTNTHPWRVVIDLKEKIRPMSAYTILTDKYPTILYTTSFQMKIQAAQWFPVGTAKSLANILKDLYDKQVQHILVEGGKDTLQRLIDANMYDTIHIWKANNVRLYQGLQAPTPPLIPFTTTVLGDNTLWTGTAD